MREPPLPAHKPLIRASELTQYSFCRRAWWLETVKGIRPEDQAARAGGRRQHERHAALVHAARRWQRTGLILLAGGAFLLAAAGLWLWLGS